MRLLPLITSLPLLALLAACGAQEGYYDANGNWVAPANATTDAQRRHSPDPGRPGYYNDNYQPRVVKYDRPGYYDYNGYYVTVDDSVAVPQNMLPPRGMCRVWLPNRLPERQPRIESCDGIQGRVPQGAYVIYGG